MKAKLVEESLTEYFELGNREMFDSLSQYRFDGTREEYSKLVNIIQNSDYDYDIGYSDKTFKIDQEADLEKLLPTNILEKISILKR